MRIQFGMPFGVKVPVGNEPRLEYHLLPSLPLPPESLNYDTRPMEIKCGVININPGEI